MTVAAERARRAGVPCVVVSACPTLELLAAGPVRLVDRRRERQGWAAVEVVDRRDDDPRAGPLLGTIGGPRPGRAPGRVRRSTAPGGPACWLCASCGEVARCERCGAALAAGRGGRRPSWSCPQCGRTAPHRSAPPARPPGCALLRVGVTRAREELEALAGRPVGEVTAASAAIPDADVLVGTEAVLHRLSPADGFGAVAFVDFDQELLAPRVRAGEEALALLAHASRLVGGRRGRVLVQTRIPDHPAIRAAVLADPGVLASDEREVRRRPAPAAGDRGGGGVRAGRARLRGGPARAAGARGAGPRRGPLAGQGRRTRPPWPTPWPAVPRPPARLRVAVDPARF